MHNRKLKDFENQFRKNHSHNVVEFLEHIYVSGLGKALDLRPEVQNHKSKVQIFIFELNVYVFTIKA